MATYYWVGGAGTWDNASTANWAALSGGPGGFGPPLAADTVNFDASSGTGTCTVASGAVCDTLVAGGANITIQLNVNLTATSLLRVNAGTFNLNNNTATSGIITSAVNAVRTIAFGSSGKFVCTRTVAVTNAVDFYNATTVVTLTGTPLVEFTGATLAGTAIGVQSESASPINPLSVKVSNGAGTFTFSSGFGFGSVTLTGFTGTLANAAFKVYGNLTIPSTTTLTAGANAVTFAATSGTQQITTNAKTLDFPITMSGTATVQLQDNLTMGATRTLTLTSGTLDLTGNSGNWTLSTGLFSSSNTSTRTIAFGTGNITLTGSGGVVWQFSTTTGLSCTGTPSVISNYAGAVGTRTIVHGSTAGGTEANAVSFNVSAGTDIITIAGFFRNFDLSGWNGTLNNNARTIYGNFLLKASTTITAGANATTFASTTSGQQNITTAANTLSFAVTLSGTQIVQLQDNFTQGPYTFSFTSGTLDLKNNILTTGGQFSSSNSNVRAIAFGTGSINISNGNDVTALNFIIATNFTYTGTPTVNLTYSGSTGTRSIYFGFSAGATEANVLNINVTAGSDIVSFVGACAVKNLNFTGFTGTLSNQVNSIYGNVTYVAGMTISAGANATTFASTSNGKTITTNAKTLDFPITFNGVGGGWTLQDNTTVGSTRTTTLTAGTLDLNGKTLSTGLFSATGATTRVLAFGIGNVTTTGSGTVWNTSSTTGFSYTGTSTVNISNNSATATTVSTGSMTEAQSLNFNYTVGTYTLTDTSAVYKSLNFTGFTGTIPNSARTIYGGATFVAGMTLTAGTNATTFAATSGTNNITTAQTWDFPITVYGLGGTFAFQDALTMGSTRAFTLTAGTVQFKAGTTNTVGSFVATSGTTKYLQSTTPGTQAIISDASGVNSANNLTIQDSFATGGATWDAFYGNGNIDGGNNTNWEFGESPVLGNEYEYKLRSMTERRRF